MKLWFLKSKILGNLFLDLKITRNLQQFKLPSMLAIQTISCLLTVFHGESKKLQVSLPKMYLHEATGWTLLRTKSLYGQSGVVLTQ